MSPAEKQKSAPADLSKEYGAPFTIISHDEGLRYNSLLSRDFTPPLSLDFGLIETLGWTRAKRTRAKMCLGNLITAIAVHFGTFDPLNTDMTVLPMLPLGISQSKNFLKKRKCYKEATAETSSSSDQVNDDQPAGLSTTPPAVDTWMLKSCKLEKMQKQIDGGFNAIETRLDELEKKMNDMRARDKTSEQKGVDFRKLESNGTDTVEELNQGNFEAKKCIDKLRIEKSESDKAARIYKTRLEKLLPSIKKIEEGISEISSMKLVDPASLVNEVREFGTFEEGEDLGFPDSRSKTDSLENGSMPIVNAEDEAVFLPGARVNSNTNGSISKGLSENDDNNSPEAWISEDDIAHTVKKSLCSQTAHNPPQQGSDDCKGCNLMERDNFEKEIENLKTIPLVLQLEEKLEKSRRKCQELKEVVARLNEEKRVLTDQVKLAEEKSDRIFTANVKMTNEKNNSISKLNEKIKELENKIMESDLLGKEFGTCEVGLMSLDSEGLGSKRKIVQEIYSERRKPLAAPAISSQPFGIIGPGLDSALSPSPPPPKRAKTGLKGSASPDPDLLQKAFDDITRAWTRPMEAVLSDPEETNQMALLLAAEKGSKDSQPRTPCIPSSP